MIKLLFATSLLGLLSIQSVAMALDLKDDVIVPTNEQGRVLTTSELNEQRSDFVSFITKFKSDVFVGYSQYIFSTLNLSQKSHVKYSLELDGTLSFQMATAGNHYIIAGDVTYPMQAKVYFELKSNTGDYLNFKTDSGEQVRFEGKKNVLYLVETEVAYANRKNIQIKFMKAGAAIGRFFAKVQYDLFTQDIEFYELDSSISNEKVLVRRGHFRGNVSPARTDF